MPFSALTEWVVSGNFTKSPSGGRANVFDHVMHLPLNACLPKSSTINKKKIDKQIAAMIQALIKAVEESTPISNFSLYSRPGFTEECKEAQQRTRQLKKRWIKNPTPEM